MTKKIILISFLLAVVIIGLKMIEYAFINRSLSVGVYIGIVVTIAIGFGLWIGREFFKKEKIVMQSQIGEEVSKTKLKDFGLSSREIEILELIDKGFTNQKIADTLFVSLSTVKTHTSNLYGKLEVNNRVQAIARAKEISGT